MTYTDALERLKNTSPLRITVSGDIGSGKSTFSKHLAAELNMPRVYIGQLMREEAKARGMTLDDFNKLLQEDDEIDRLMDQKTHEVSKQEERGIFEGRTAWHFTIDPDAKVFLRVDPDVSAERIWKEKNDTLRDTYASIDDLKRANKERKKSEEARFNQYYDISAYDRKNFDIVVDTTDLSIKEVFEQTVIAIAKHLQK